MPSSKNRFEALNMAPISDEIIPASRKQIRELPIDQIYPGPYQYRKFFDEEKISELAEIFQAKGMRGVLWVEPDLSEPDKYFLISGERSWRAAKKAGFETVTCEVIEGLSDTERAELGYVANEAAESLNLLEDTLAILDILSLNLRLTHEDTISVLWHLNNSLTRHRALNQDAVIQLEAIEATMVRIKSGVGSWRNFIKNRIPLLKLPDELLSAVSEGLIDGSAAMEIKKLEKPKQRQALVDRTIEEGLSYRDVKEAVSELRPTPKPHALVKRYRSIERRLPDALKNRDKAKEIKSLIAQLEKLISGD